MAGRVLQAAVVGASSLLGKELVQEISQSAAAVWDLRLLDESDEAEGQLTSAGDEAFVIHKLSDASFEGVDVLFFAGTAQATRQYSVAATRAGAAIVDLTGALDGEPGFLVRSPWMQNGQKPDLTTVGVVNPHPAALMLALVAERVDARFGVEDIAATILEPASQAGAKGVDELHQQTISLLSFQELPKEVFGTQVAFNLQSALGEDGSVRLSETRMRVRQDLARLLDGRLHEGVSVQVLQAPVFHGYVISSHVRLGVAASVADVRSILGNGVVSAQPEIVASNQAATESSELLVNVDAETPAAEPTKSYWLTLAADNLGLAARSAVQAALELVALRPAARVQ